MLVKRPIRCGSWQKIILEVNSEAGTITLARDCSSAAIFFVGIHVRLFSVLFLYFYIVAYHCVRTELTTKFLQSQGFLTHNEYEKRCESENLDSGR